MASTGNETVDFKRLLQNPTKFYQHNELFSTLLKFLRNRTNKYLHGLGRGDRVEEQLHFEVFNELFEKLSKVKEMPDDPEHYTNRVISNLMTDLLSHRSKINQNTSTVEDIDKEVETQQQKDVAEAIDELDEDRQLIRAWLVFKESIDSQLIGYSFKVFIVGVRAALLDTVQKIKQQFKNLVPTTRERDVFLLRCHHEFEWDVSEVAELLEISEPLVYLAQKNAIKKLKTFQTKFER
jgi:RNA polymerase sigma factor (sigma-70 family)